MATQTKIGDVAGLCGIKLDFSRADKSNPKTHCPSCGKYSAFVSITKDKWFCHSCHDGGGALSLYMRVCNLTDPKQAARELGRATKPLGDRHYETPKVEPESENIADDNALDNTYRTLLSEMKLSARHKKDLIKRGLTEAEIETLGYKTYVASASAARRVQKSGAQIKFVPGFFNDEKELSVNLAWNTECIMVPYYNEKRECVRIQLRRNNEDVTEDFGKYSYLTSANKKDGAKASVRTHFACDWARKFSTGEWSPILGDTVLLTEGAMKADIAHICTGEPIIAIPGVSSVKKCLKPIFQYLKSRGVKKIVDILDMDYQTNPNVKDAMNTLRQLVKAAGLEYERRDWEVSPEEGVNLKGYDDFAIYMRNRGRR